MMDKLIIIIKKIMVMYSKLEQEVVQETIKVLKLEGIVLLQHKQEMLELV